MIVSPGWTEFVTSDVLVSTSELTDSTALAVLLELTGSGRLEAVIRARLVMALFWVPAAGVAVISSVAAEPTFSVPTVQAPPG